MLVGSQLIQPADRAEVLALTPSGTRRPGRVRQRQRQVQQPMLGRKRNRDRVETVQSGYRFEILAEKL